jgi:hypothetical protein
MIAGLVNHGLVTLTAEKVRAGGKRSTALGGTEIAKRILLFSVGDRNLASKSGHAPGCRNVEAVT